MAAQASRALPALVAAVHSGERRVAFTFAGQGAPWWDGLLELWSTPGAAQVFLAAAETALLDELSPGRRWPGASDPRRGVLPLDSQPCQRPYGNGKNGVGLSMPMIYVVGVARALSLLEGGLSRCSANPRGTFRLSQDIRRGNLRRWCSLWRPAWMTVPHGKTSCCVLHAWPCTWGPH